MEGRSHWQTSDEQQTGSPEKGKEGHGSSARQVSRSPAEMPLVKLLKKAVDRGRRAEEGVFLPSWSAVLADVYRGEEETEDT